MAIYYVEEVTLFATYNYTYNINLDIVNIVHLYSYYPFFIYKYVYKKYTVYLRACKEI
jgi:hypothetical protein